MLKSGIGAVALTSILLSSAAWAQEKIKVGVTATLEGTYTVLGEDGIRGFKVAVNKYGPKAGGKELEFVIASTDATPDSAVRASGHRKLQPFNGALLHRFEPADERHAYHTRRASRV